MVCESSDRIQQLLEICIGDEIGEVPNDVHSKRGSVPFGDHDGSTTSWSGVGESELQRQRPRLTARSLGRGAQYKMVTVVWDGGWTYVQVGFHTIPVSNLPVIDVEGIGANADSIVVPILKLHAVTKRDAPADARLLIPQGVADVLTDLESQAWRAGNGHLFAESNLDPDGLAHRVASRVERRRGDHEAPNARRRRGWWSAGRRRRWRRRSRSRITPTPESDGKHKDQRRAKSEVPAAQ